MREFNEKFVGLSEGQQAIRYHQLALACLEHYAVQVERIDFIGHNAGVAYHVETPQQDLLLKIAHPTGEGSSDSPENIRAGLRWVYDLANQTDIAVQRPLLNRAGDLLTTVNFHDLSEPFYCSLQQWLDGEHPRNPTPDHAYAIGEMTAKLHNHASGWERDNMVSGSVYDGALVERCLNDFKKVIEWEMLPSSAWSTVEAASQQMIAMMETLGQDASVWGPFHGDLSHVNILFKDGQARPIDFSSLRIGHFIYDLGVTLYHFMYLDAAVRQALLDGYRAKRAEVQLPHMAAEAFLCVAALENLAFQVTLSWQRTSPLMARNTREFTDVFCRKLLDDVPFALV